jgi:hypothetical protein
VAALLRRVHPARAQVDGPGRSATRHRYAAQITHVVAFYLVLRPQPKAVGALADGCGGILESPRVCSEAVDVRVQLN